MRNILMALALGAIPALLFGQAIRGEKGTVSGTVNVTNPPVTGDGSAGSPLALDPSSATLQGNQFNGADQLLQLDGAGALPAIDGSALTGITAEEENTYTSSKTFTDGGFSVGGSTFTIQGGSVSIGLDYYPSKLAVNGSFQWGTRVGHLSSGTAEGAMIIQNNTQSEQQLRLIGAAPIISFEDNDNTNGQVQINGGIMMIGTTAAAARFMIDLNNGHTKVYVDGAFPALSSVFEVGSDSSLYSVAVSSADGNLMFSVTGSGHLTAPENTAPAVTSCGTSPSIAGSDIAGKVTIGSSAAGTCTITFQEPYLIAPACTVTGEDGAVQLGATTTTTELVITDGAGDFSSDVIMYTCIGN